MEAHSRPELRKGRGRQRPPHLQGGGELKPVLDMARDEEKAGRPDRMTTQRARAPDVGSSAVVPRRSTAAGAVRLGVGPAVRVRVNEYWAEAGQLKQQRRPP